MAQSKYLESEEFLNYLNYLEYWRKPENAKYLIYPNCLHVLTLLKEPRFRQEISRADVAKMFMDDFYMTWLNKGRIGDDELAPEANAANSAEAAAAGSGNAEVKTEKASNGN